MKIHDEFLRQYDLRQVSYDVLPDLVTNPAEPNGPFFKRAFKNGWVAEWFVNEPGTGRKVRAIIVRVIADGKDITYVLTDEPIDGFRTMPANVNADLGHNRNGFRPNKTRFGARAKNRKRRT